MSTSTPSIVSLPSPPKLGVLGTLHDPIDPPSSPAHEIVGESEVMRRLRLQVRRLGPHFRTVLLRGEAGTGKELVARSLHSCSTHAKGYFLIFRCAMSDVTRSDISSAEERVAGALREAHRGTLYLDKVCALSIAGQAGLLEALRRRDRARGPILVHGLEARIVASTSEDLRLSVATGRFHAELYQRLSTVEIELPPLRDRLEDVRALSEYFVRIFSAEYGKCVQIISREATECMSRYHWPGNVDELQQRIRSAVLESAGDRIEAEHVQSLPSATAPAATTSAARLQDVVEQHVFQVLKHCAGNKVKAAEMLGISRSTLYRMLDTGIVAGKAERLR
jgi:DNA-binding NtrC family response regulator